MRLPGLWLTFLVFSVGAASAVELTPELYVRADLDARAATLDGMQEQIDLLSHNTATVEVQRQVDANRSHVAGVFGFYGTTAAAHAVYGSRYRQAIEAWLMAHPEWQQAYQDAAQKFEQLAGQLDHRRGRK